MLVVDASVLAPALADDGEDGSRVRKRLVGRGPLLAPELVDLEVVSVLRRAVRARRLDPERAMEAVEDLETLPLRRVPHAPLLPAIWLLRDKVSAYDGAYIALAKTMSAILVTADRGLFEAAGNCAKEFLPSSS